MNKINITIGITAYNEGQYLQEAWDSIINQTTNNWEAIMILDGGSDIKTEKVFDDINGEIKDVGKMETWYEDKFMKEDVISNMKGYWANNKADIIKRLNSLSY